MATKVGMIKILAYAVFQLIGHGVYHMKKRPPLCERAAFRRTVIANRALNQILSALAAVTQVVQAVHYSAGQQQRHAAIERSSCGGDWGRAAISWGLCE